MRFVPINCVRNGMICGKKLLGKNGTLLLNKGAVIYDAYIETIKELGYSGIYVDDDVSKEIEIVEVINLDLRLKAVSTIKNVFINLEAGKTIPDKSVEVINQMVGDIIDDIMSNKQLMVNMMDLKLFDDYTFYHCVNVGVLSIVMGMALGLNKDQLQKLGLAGLLHDIGKVFIPKEILNKPGKLTDQEYEEMKSHTSKGFRYLKEKFNIPTSSYVGVLQHHERYDGKGYPNSISGEKISLFGRIIAVADVYDALTSNRPYREALIPSEAVEFIMASSKAVFDPVVVNTFIQKVAPYPIGTCVILSDEKVGIVVENYSECCLRPKIKIIKHKNKEVEPYYLNLKEDRNALDITIVRIGDISY